MQALRQCPRVADGRFYSMYALQRVGVASGRKYFGNVDWYRSGCEVLLKGQHPHGGWGRDNLQDNANCVPNTCFALLFLTRGRAPVLMNKLAHTFITKDGKEAAWNQRPRDLAHFAGWMSRSLNTRYLNWQVVDLNARSEDLHDAPILYIAGSSDLAFTDEKIGMLWQFVEQGGLILGNADCGNKRFVTGLTTLGRKLFPRYEFRELEPTHPILAGQQFPAAKWKKKPKLLSLGNGVRELMVIVPDEDLSRAWQANADRQRPETFQLGSNLYLYSTRENLRRTRGDTRLVGDEGRPAPARQVRG